MAFRWRADNGPILNASLVALLFFRGSGPVLLRNPIFLWFSRESSDPLPPPPSGSAHAGLLTAYWYNFISVHQSCFSKLRDRIAVEKFLHRRLLDQRGDNILGRRKVYQDHVIPSLRISQYFVLSKTSRKWSIWSKTTRKPIDFALIWTP